jgi:hypothetical protein
MLVVDRRNDQGAYSSGSNRAEVQSEREALKLNTNFTASSVVPAMVEVERRPGELEGSGVLCVVETPGPKKLLDVLFKRVWGKES